jgi:hypothetical protein
VYDFPAAVSDVPAVEHVSFQAFSGTNVGVSRLTGGQASVASWSTAGGPADTTEYASLSFQAHEGYTLGLTGLTFKSSSSSSGPSHFYVTLRVGGALQESSALFASSSTTTQTASMPVFTFDFADIGGIVAGSLVEFRFYGEGATHGAGSLRLDDIAISGSTLSSVPEPSAFTLGAGVMILAFAFYRRRLR